MGSLCDTWRRQRRRSDLRVANQQLVELRQDGDDVRVGQFIRLLFRPKGLSHVGRHGFGWIVGAEGVAEGAGSHAGEGVGIALQASAEMGREIVHGGCGPAMIGIGKKPRYSIRSIGQLDSGKKLLSRLQDLLVSDIARTGVNNRGQLSSLITSISQGLFKNYIRNNLEEVVDMDSDSSLPWLEEAFWFFLSGAQDPDTGYWGAWYIVDGKVYKTSDLSMTYHIVSYTKGKGLERWQNLIATTLAIESDPYPYGWKHHGSFNNHNLYDVAKIYKYGWRHMDQSQRASIGTQIQSMLDWSLSNTLDDDRNFIHNPSFSDSLADEYYFGVSFYDVVGYWNPDYRFWTEKTEFEGAMELCCHIEQRLNELDLSGWAAEGARAKLARNCSGC